jgi:hypothetical protein
MSGKIAHPASRFSEQYRNYKQSSFKTKGKTKESVEGNREKKKTSNRQTGKCHL